VPRKFLSTLIPVRYRESSRIKRESYELSCAISGMRRSAPEVQQFYYLTGEVDFILVITNRDMSE